jgi:thymidine phosphorylase
VDPAVGLVVHRKLGDRVERGEALCTVHEGDRSEPRERVVARLRAAWSIAAAAPPPRPLVVERIR